MMPRLRAWGEGVMVALSMVNETSPHLFRVDLVPMRRSSILSAFSQRKLWVNQDLMMRDAVGERWVVGGFGAEVDLGVVGITMIVQVEVPNPEGPHA